MLQPAVERKMRFAGEREDHDGARVFDGLNELFQLGDPQYRAPVLQN